MTTPQPEHITILPPQKTKRRHTRRWKATVTILVILLLAAAAIGGTLLHQHNKANSFPTFHAQGKDMVLQLQALYKESPDHVSQALTKGNNPHIKSQIIGGGMEGELLDIYIEIDNPAGDPLTLGIDRPTPIERGTDQGKLSSLIAFNGIRGPVVVIEEGQHPYSDETNDEWQQAFHMSKQQGISLATHWVRTVLNTAADNW